MGRTKDGDDLLLGGEGDGTRNTCARTSCGFDDLLCALVDEIVLICLELNADAIVCHFYLLFSIVRLSPHSITGLYTLPCVLIKNT